MCGICTLACSVVGQWRRSHECSVAIYISREIKILALNLLLSLFSGAPATNIYFINKHSTYEIECTSPALLEPIKLFVSTPLIVLDAVFGHKWSVFTLKYLGTITDSKLTSEANCEGHSLYVLFLSFIFYLPYLSSLQYWVLLPLYHVKSCPVCV